MKNLRTLALTSAVAAIFSSSTLMAEVLESTGSQFSEPSRGFMLEHGSTANKGDISVDLLTGSYNTAGGIRIGLGDTEIIINSGLNGASTNEIALKYGYPAIDTSYGVWNLAAYGGLSYYDDDMSESVNTYTFGGAFTLKADKATITLNPQVSLIDAGAFNETMYSIGAGAYYELVENDNGRFSPGFEITYNDYLEETEYSAGLRWAVNDRATIDFAVLNKVATGINSSVEMTDFPGVIRLNVAL